MWKLPTAVVGVALGSVLLLLVAAAGVMVTSAARTAVLNKAVGLANERTGLDIDLGGLYLSPFHHSPRALYRAYKGDADLPVQIEVDSLFVGHRGQDTLIYVRSLRLDATLLTAGRGFMSKGDGGVKPESDGGVTSESESGLCPINVGKLSVERLTFHSDSLIAAVGIDAIVGSLDVSSPELNIARGQYPLHGLRLDDAYVGIDLRGTADTTAVDTVPLQMAFEVPDGEIRNLRFVLTPAGMDVHTDTLAVNVLADVGGNRYDLRRMDAGGTSVSMGELFLPFDTIDGNVSVDLNTKMISSRGFHVRSDEMGAEANLRATVLDLQTMRVDVDAAAAYHDGTAHINGFYDIDDEEYDVLVSMERMDLSPLLKDSMRVAFAGDIHAEGRGVNPQAPMQSKVQMHLTDCVYDDISVADIRMNFATADTTALALTTEGLNVDVRSPMPVMQLVDHISAFSSYLSTANYQLSNLSYLDTIHQLFPDLRADVRLTHGSPAQLYLDRMGLDIDEVTLALASDARQTNLALDASIPQISHPEDSTAMRIPAAKAAVRVNMTQGRSTASLEADTKVTDGAMMVRDLQTAAALRFDLERTGNDLEGTGRLTLDDLSFTDMQLGSRSVDIKLSPSKRYANALKAEVHTDDIPLDLVDSILRMPDVDLQGTIRAQATIDGMPDQLDLSAELLPMRVSAEYKPYQVMLSLGDQPIRMEHNRVTLNHFPIYGVDSTFIAFTGGLDLDSRQLNITLAADSFAPAKLIKDGVSPVHGDLALDVHGTVAGTLDSIQTDVDVAILPTTDITYQIDKKNLAQVKPYGKVNVKYGVADGTLDLNGRINVDDGFIRYSPKAYPIMPFHVDSGSHIAFNGAIGRTMLDVSASQQVKSSVQSAGEDSRMVDFRTGVRVQGMVDSLDVDKIGFFLEAPKDEAVTNELASVDEDTREGLAAALLATGMYMGDSNARAHEGNYALTSIINSRLNAAMTNSKMGKIIDVDVSSAKSQRAVGETNDVNIAIGKSFFNDRLRISLGAALADNPEAYKNLGFLNNITAEYKLTKNGDVSLRAFGQRDYNNILEGELFKSGIGIRTTHQWDKTSPADSIVRTYSLTADADVAWRSNNSLGPNLTLTSSIKNLMGKGETLSIKGNGAYYWALRDRLPSDPKMTDTYKLGVSTSLVFPYLHWAGDNNPDGDTRYTLGYQYENIAGGYGVHKMSGSMTYYIRSSRYVTHSFTPFSLSIVRMNTATDTLNDKTIGYPQLIKLFIGNEFSPAVAYHFTYSDYRDKRGVNTMLDLGIKESANLINALYCAFGYKWNDRDKPLGSITFTQFVKLTAELRNKYNFTDQVCIATRLYAGANIPLGNSNNAPLSESFYAGGANSMRACSPYAYGSGNFYSTKYNQSFFHAGDVKLEANFELRFPIVWKLYGAAFVDAGNVWNWLTIADLFKQEGIDNYKDVLGLQEDLYDGFFNNPYLLSQIALGTGAGLRLDFDGLVIRLDLGVGIHAPYQTYKRDKDRKYDYTQPISTYFNMPTALDALRLNFGIGYPF